MVRHIQSGGKLKVGGDVLLGLSHWQSLIEKPGIVDTLLNNMSDELAVALESSKLPLRPSKKASELEIFVTAGFQQKGIEWLSGTIPDLSPLLTAPHVLHAKPGELPHNTPFSLQLATGKNESVLFMGSSISRDQSTVSLEFMVNNQIKQISLPNQNAMTGIADEGPKLAKEPNEYGLPVPGEVVSLNIEPGTVLESGRPLATVESMKMQMQLTVPKEFHGHIVNQIYPRVRSASDQGSILPKNGLFFSVSERRSFSTMPTRQSLRAPMAKPLVTRLIVPDVHLTTRSALISRLRTTIRPLAALGVGTFAMGATFFSGK